MDSGSFSAHLATESNFGLFRFYGTFALMGYLPGSNVSLVQPDGGWTNSPLYLGARLIDYITVSSRQPSVDLGLPIVMRGAFSKSGTPMDNGDLGATGDIGFTLSIRTTDNPVSYHDSTFFGVSDDGYVPGTRWLVLRSVPTNRPLRIQFICGASMSVTDEIQYTDKPGPVTESDITSSEFYRTGPYSLNGTIDFGDGILFGWYAVSKDGFPVQDASVASRNGFAYSAVPYEICALFDQSRPVKQGAAIPIKLQLCDGSGNNLSSPSVVLTAARLMRIPENKVVVLGGEGRSNSDFLFRYDPSLGGYICVLSTRELTPGTYQLSFTAGEEPLEYSVHFEVR